MQRNSEKNREKEEKERHSVIDREKDREKGGRSERKVVEKRGKRERARNKHYFRR